MEKESVEAFVERLSAPLVGALTLYSGGDRATAEDLAQEALARTWERWDRIDRPEAFLYRVAFNLARSRWRRRSIERRANAQWASDPSGPASDDDAIERTDGTAALRAAIAHLPDRQRQAIVLRYDLDLSIGDVAQAMRCSVGTVKSTLHHARAALKRDCPELNELVTDDR